MRALCSRLSPFALALAFALPLAPQALADCAEVNSGVFNRTAYTPPGSGVLNTSTGFSVGDTLTFTVSGLAGSSFELINGSLNTALLTQPLSASLATLSYTVTGSNSDTTLNTYMLVQAIPFEITIVATCVPVPSPSGSSYDRGVTKGFLLSRINGMLLNSPASTSLMQRSNGAPVSGGAAGFGAPGAAYDSGPSGSSNMIGNILSGSSGASPMSGVMGLGAGLDSGLGSGLGTGIAGGGSSVIIGASRFDDAQPGSPGSGAMSFSTSLSQIRRDAARAQMDRDRMSLGAGDGATLPAAFAIYSPWDVWAEGRFSGFNNDAGNLDGKGHVGLLFVGSDYRITPDMIVGALVQFDWAQDETGLLASKVDGNGWMAGPYLSARVYENIYLDLRAAWGSSSNDLAIGATTGSFDTSRWLVKGTLAGNWLYDAWRITPSAELAYVTESQDAFTNSAGVLVPGQDVSLGRLQFGPEFGYRIRHDASTFIEPFAALKGVWDFDNPNVQIIDGITVGPGDFWGRLEGGLNVMTADGWYVRGLASWDGVGSSDYNGYTLQGILNVPLN